MIFRGKNNFLTGWMKMIIYLETGETRPIWHVPQLRVITGNNETPASFMN